MSKVKECYDDPISQEEWNKSKTREKHRKKSGKMSEIFFSINQQTTLGRWKKVKTLELKRVFLEKRTKSKLLWNLMEPLHYITTTVKIELQRRSDIHQED